MSYIFWGFLFGVLIPYMAAYAFYRLLWPVKTVSDERKRANPAYQKLMSAYVMRSLGYGIITAAISYAAYWQFGAAHLWWYLAFIWILLLLTEIDYKTMYLPDILTFPLLLAGFLYAVLVGVWVGRKAQSVRRPGMCCRSLPACFWFGNIKTFSAAVISSCCRPREPGLGLNFCCMLFCCPVWCSAFMP